MKTRELEGLIGRMRLARRAVAPGERPAVPDAGRAPDRVGALEARVAHLERLLEGLQDSVHRESDRHDKLLAEIHAQIQPGVIGAALAEDARNRGL